jgi:CheY-like chemotaxis protein
MKWEVPLNQNSRPTSCSRFFTIACSLQILWAARSALGLCVQSSGCREVSCGKHSSGSSCRQRRRCFCPPAGYHLARCRVRHPVAPGRRSCLCEYHATSPRVILLDINSDTPQTSWRFVDLLLLDPQTAGIPLIICSVADQTLRDRTPKLRAAGYTIIEKPFPLGEVLEQVRAAIDRSR